MAKMSVFTFPINLKQAFTFSLSVPKHNTLPIMARIKSPTVIVNITNFVTNHGIN